MNDERRINPKLDVHPADTTGSYALAFISGGNYCWMRGVLLLVYCPEAD